MLNALTDAALQKRGFQWAAPVHMLAGEGEYDEVDEGDGGIADEADAAAQGGAADGGSRAARLPSATGRAPPHPSTLDDEPLDADSGDGGDDDDALYIGDSDDAGGGGGGGGGEDASGSAVPRRAHRHGRRRTKPILWGSVDPALWQEECERVAPSLVLKVTWDQLSWRHRVDLASTHAPIFTSHAPAVMPPLEVLSTTSQTSLETIAPLREKHAEKQRLLDEATEAFAAAQSAQQARSNQLVELDDAIRRAKEGAGLRGEELSGNAPLERIRGALKALRAEVRSLAVKEAMMHRVVEARRASGERRKAEEAKRRGAAPTTTSLPNVAGADDDEVEEAGSAYPSEWRD